jgi:hypothetical protein
MAQFTNMGPHKRNVSRHTSKGYGIHRVGRRTVHVWGPIESIGRRMLNEFRWISKNGTPERREVRVHPTILAAKKYVERVKQRKQYHGYKQLEKGDRIKNGKSAR